jgi:hypothetical protein
MHEKTKRKGMGRYGGDREILPKIIRPKKTADGADAHG